MVEPGDPGELAEGTLISHLLELRDRMLRALLAVGIAFIPCVIYMNPLFTFIAEPLKKKLPAGANIISTTPPGVQMMTEMGNYLDFVMILLLAFGLAFEVPVATVLLVWTGFVKIKTLKKNRGFVILGLFIFAAFVTPPDAISQSAMAIPMCVLYEIGIIMAGILLKDKIAAREQEEREQETQG